MKVIKTEFQTNTAPPKVLPDEAQVQFLQSLTSFSMYGGHFDWDSAAFVGLEHLQLERINPEPTLGEIVRMLRASPRLCTLSLDRISMAQKETSHAHVYLQHLQRLSLTSLGEGDLCALVPLLFPGSRPLALHLENELKSNVLIQLFCELFQCSNIQSLYFYHSTPRQAMSNVFSALPHLRHLYCSHNDMGDIFTALSVPVPTESFGVLAPLLPCPHLYTLHLSDCSFKVTVERSIGPITNQPSLVVKFEDCMTPDPGKLSRNELAGGKVDFEPVDCDSLNEPSFDGLDPRRITVLELGPDLLGPNTFNVFLRVPYGGRRFRLVT
ncbi:hypothetical protein FRC08_010854 [Ceratobasidium sp. 394]|nr:hypothetical protein FRC08_010854 [Ceratobasidium sp. 394]KAG9091017.1 hypothetical protein FS749_000127 [Ceratobasidium sp. UAMH 11750]